MSALKYFESFSLAWFDICVIFCSVFCVVADKISITYNGRLGCFISVFITTFYTFRKSFSSFLNYINTFSLVHVIFILLLLCDYLLLQGVTRKWVPWVFVFLDTNVLYPLHRTRQIPLFTLLLSLVYVFCLHMVMQLFTQNFSLVK